MQPKSKRTFVLQLSSKSGKSLCFQAPALFLPQLTLVISPLISLMKDQIDSLLDLGVPAARMDSTMSHPERNETYERLRSRQLKLLYVLPERLLMQGFLDFLKERGVPAYIVFSDVTLREIVIRRPSTGRALLLVSGIGMKKLEQYGEQIIEMIRRHSAKQK